MNKEEKRQMQKEVAVLFKVYDIDCSGELDKEEFYLVQNDLRKTLSLGGQPQELFDKAFWIIDKDKSGTVSAKELNNCLEEILPILCSPDEQITEFIKNKFRELDQDNSGYLERDEIKSLLDDMCVQMKRQKCEPWKVDYIISLIDDDGNCQIDIDEFMFNYNILNEQIENNPPLGISEYKYNQMCQARDANRENLSNEIEILARIAKKFLNGKKTKDQKVAREIQCDDNRLSNLNLQSFRNSKKIIPINNLINQKVDYDEEDQNAKDDVLDIVADAQEFNDVFNALGSKNRELDPKEKVNENVEYFSGKNYQNLDEMAEAASKTLIIIEKFMKGIKNFLVFNINDFYNKKGESEDQNYAKLDDYKKIINSMDKTFQEIGYVLKKSKKTQTWNPASDDLVKSMIKRQSVIVDNNKGTSTKNDQLGNLEGSDDIIEYKEKPKDSQVMRKKCGSMLFELKENQDKLLTSTPALKPEVYKNKHENMDIFRTKRNGRTMSLMNGMSPDVTNRFFDKNGSVLYKNSGLVKYSDKKTDDKTQVDQYFSKMTPVISKKMIDNYMPKKRSDSPAFPNIRSSYREQSASQLV